MLPIGLLMGLCAGLAIAAAVIVVARPPHYLNDVQQLVLKHRTRGLYVFWATFGGLIGQVIEIWVR
jgi:hypothetical protein